MINLQYHRVYEGVRALGMIVKNLFLDAPVSPPHQPLACALTL